MITTILTAFVRYTQLEKLAKYAKVQAAYAKAKAWYKAQPREIQVIVILGVLLAAIAALVL